VALDQQHWQDRLTALTDKHGIVGASLAIRHGDQTVEAAAGVLNLRTQQPVTTDSLFQIGSISKVWTATLVMQLVDEGLLDLDEPVIKHLPDFTVADPEVTRTVTTRQLLAHTSGIDGDLFLDTGRGDDAVEKYVAAMADLKQVHPQGATMSYCNSGFTLLGRLIEVLRGQTWDTVLKERLFAPLGLTSAGTLPEEALLHGAATGHVVPAPGQEPVVTPQWGIYRSAGPAGLIHCTARDVLAFAQLHLDGGTTPDGTRVLSADSVAAMQEPQVEVPDPYTLGSHWGLGWILMSWDGRQLFGHDGGTLGQGAFLRILPEAGLSVALCTNGGTHVRELFEAVYGEIFAELAGVELPPRPEPTPGATLDDPSRFTGRYAREGIEMTIGEHDGGLQAVMKQTGELFKDMPEPPPMELRPFQGDVLVARGADDGAWNAAVFFDLHGERYVHFGARATRRVG
jgi:CubicO group peptidase (beta-lactamase class C family)